MEPLRKKTPRERFLGQRYHAARRGIPFLLSFEDWWSIWQASGKWEQRGRRSGQYQMCRKGDAGAYEKGNVYIATCFDNLADGHRVGSLHRPDEAGLALAATRAGRKRKYFSDEERQAARRVYKQTELTKRRAARAEACACQA